MILSRVAERIYWTARYLQRVESSARLVNVYTNLLLDVPKEVRLSWFGLIELNNGQRAFDTRYKIRDERNVIKFTLVDNTNPSSMLVSLSQIRENLRTTRDVVPENAWELINGLNSFVQESISNGALNRAQRQKFLTQVINQCQMIQGYIASTTSHDAIWDIWTIGRDLERADMSTRILEAGASIVLNDSDGEPDKVQTPLIVWGNVLRSSGADHAYRRAVSPTVRGKKVIRFLLYNELFPRSVRFCLEELKYSIKNLPKQRKVMEGCRALDDLLDETALAENLDHDFLNYINKLQLRLADLNHLFSETWFSLER